MSSSQTEINSFPCIYNNNIYDNRVSVESPSFMHEGITSTTPLSQKDLAVEKLMQLGYISAIRAADLHQCAGPIPVYLECTNCSTTKIVRDKGCDHRLCDLCMLRRRKVAYAKFADMFKGHDDVRFLTLSFKNTPDIKKEYLQEYTKVFTKTRLYLKRMGYRLGTYARVMEVKWTPDAGWNVHYHILYRGDWIPREKVVEAFTKASKGKSWYGYISKINRRGADKPGAALSYVLKYLGKVEGVMEDAQRIVDFYIATEKMRFYQTYIAPECPECQDHMVRKHLTMGHDKLSWYECAQAHHAPIDAFRVRMPEFACDVCNHSTWRRVEPPVSPEEEPFIARHDTLQVGLESMDSETLRYLCTVGDVFESSPGVYRWTE